MKLDREFFLKRYRAMDDEALFASLVDVEPSDAALEAAREVFAERGLDDARVVERMRAASRQHRPGAATNTCDYCGKSLAYGAVRDGARMFCRSACAHAVRVAERAEDVDIVDAWALAESLRKGECPRCGCVDGTVQLRRAHHVWSYIRSFVYSVETQLRCRRCGRNANRLAILGNVLAGWWSPAGLFVTPACIIRNFREIGSLDGTRESTPQLVAFARLRLAEQALAAEAPEPPEADDAP